MTDSSTVDPGLARLSNSVRTAMIVEAVLGIVAGAILLFWPGPTLLVLALFFGAALLLAGIYRLAFAFAGPVHDRRSRILLGILGALVFLAGLVTLIHPGSTLVVIAIFVGVAWVFSGVQELMVGLSGRSPSPKWVAVGGGILSIVAGIIAFTLPGVALSTFALIGGIMLIIVSIAVLAHLPRRLPESGPAFTR